MSKKLIEIIILFFVIPSLYPVYSETLSFKIPKKYFSDDVKMLSLSGDDGFDVDSSQGNKKYNFKRLSGLNSTGMRQTYVGRAKTGDKLICNSHLKATDLGEEVLVLGNVVDTSDFDLDDLQVVELDYDRLNSRLSAYLYAHSLSLLAEPTKLEICITFKDGEAFLSEVFELQTDRGVYSGTYFHDSLTVTPKFFHTTYTTTASLKVYPKRITDENDIEYVDVTNLMGDFTLSKKSHYMESSPVSQINEFYFEPSSDDFAKASMFYWFDKHYKFMQSLGFKEYAQRPIVIDYPKTDSSNINNAAYSPSQSWSPRITVGKGDGQKLKNLGLDEDVISHELNHHIIWEHIAVTVGESLMLHEGLADYFVFERTGDSCLGEAICPLNTKSCYLSKSTEGGPSCLRYTDIDFKYKDSKYNAIKSEHLRGQLIASMLENISENMPEGEGEKLTYNALVLVPYNCDIKTFILALFHSDLNNYQGAYREVIRDNANNAGFYEYTKNISVDLNQGLPEIKKIRLSDVTTVVKKTTTTTQKPWWHFGCALGHQKSSNNQNYLLNILLFLFPLLPYLSLKLRR